MELKIPESFLLRGQHYELTSAGHDLFTACQSLGEWGARWLEIAPENLDPFVAPWSMCNALRRDRLADQRVVIRFHFTGHPRRERYWLLIEIGESARRAPASTRTFTSRRKPKPSSNGTPARSTGPKPPATAASNSTALRRW
jgi:hypothetical protein